MSAGQNEYDGIILGTGHNALVLQAYLSRCGLRTLSVDRAEVPGGGLSTIENPAVPGVHHNPHSFFHRSITSMPWYRDLELESYGVRYIEPELNVAMLLKDGRSLQWWTDPEQTIESFSNFSKRDANSLRRWMEEFAPIVENILVPESQCPPLETGLRRTLLEQSKQGRRLLTVSELSPLEFVTREFEHDAVRAGMLFFNGLREVDLRLKGFGHAIPSLLASKGKAQMCVGGSSKLAEGLVTDIEKHGGEILCSVEIDQILTERGKASGILLTNGETIRANGFIASGLNPQQTFLEFLPESATSEDLRRRAGSFEYNLLAPLFGLHLALKEAPEYSASQTSPELGDAFMLILGLEKFEQFHEIVSAHEKGRIPSPVSWGTSPTCFDPSQASKDLHTAFMWEKLPYRLSGDPKNWVAEREKIGNRILEHWRKYAPNLSGDNILNHFSLSPLDTEITLPNMAGGDLLVGAFSNNQIGSNRPFAGAGTYRTPVEGLYLCGGSTHPGGNITGLCGFNAASVIAADCNRMIWWERPDIETALSSID